MAGTPLVSSEDLPPGTARALRLHGREWLVVHVDGAPRVLEGRCPHAGAPLGQAALAGCTLTCPWHGSQFDARDGALLRGPATRPLAVCPSRLEEGWVVVEA